MTRRPIVVRLRWTAFSVLFLSGLIYGLLTRHFDEHLSRWILPTLFLTSPLLIASIRALLNPGRLPSLSFYILVICFVTLLYAFTLFGLRALLVDIESWLRQPRLDRPVTVVVVSILVGSTGLMLFYLRLKLRFIYGLTEVVAGLAVSTHKVFTELNSVSSISAGWSLALLTAGIYLVVRGLDNMHQGLTKEPLDAGLLWLLQWFPWTTRGEARLAFSAIRSHLSHTPVVPARAFRLKCLAYEDPVDIVIKVDYLRRRIPTPRRTTFLILEDENLVFHLAGEQRTLALNLPHVSLWTPPGADALNENWVVVPHQQREHWQPLSEAALASVAR